MREATKSSKVLKTTKRKPPNAGKGRVKGTPNKFTASVKDAIKTAFDQLQGVPGASLIDWAKGNPTEFYKIASKLIPTEIIGDKENPLEVVVSQRPQVTKEEWLKAHGMESTARTTIKRPPR